MLQWIFSTAAVSCWEKDITVRIGVLSPVVSLWGAHKKKHEKWSPTWKKEPVVNECRYAFAIHSPKKKTEKEFSE